MRIVGQSSAQNSYKEKLTQTKKSYNEKINALQAQHKALMEPVYKELAELKKQDGEQRKLRQTDSTYPNAVKARQVEKEIKTLIAEKQAAVEEIQKSANFQSMPPVKKPA